MPRIKTSDQLQHELDLRDLLEKERDKSDRNYAIKLVQTIVFTLVGLLAIGVVSALIKLVVLK